MSKTVKSLIGLAVLTAGSLALYAEVPKGWYMAGSKPTDYESSVDTGNAYGGQPSAYLRSKKPEVPEGFGTLMQNFSAEQYVGKRVRFSAFVKSENIERWAGLWMRVDGKPGQTLSFDNMQDRPIKGTSAWRNCEVVLDVPAGALGIYFGILLDGPGTVWMNNAKFEEVATSIPTTGKVQAPAPGPTNLGFDK
jgi:hypothetical protein